MSKDKKLTPNGADQLSSAQAFLALLRRYEIVSVFFDADQPDVVMPSGYTGTTQLDYGLNLAVPIPDLFVSRMGIRATLSFKQVWFKTFIPWTSVLLFRPSGQLTHTKSCGFTAPADEYDLANGAKPDMPFTCVLAPHEDEVEHVCIQTAGPTNANAKHLRLLDDKETPPIDLPPPPPELRTPSGRRKRPSLRLVTSLAPSPTVPAPKTQAPVT